MSAYTKFITDRDLALEKIYRNAQMEIADKFRGAFRTIVEQTHYIFSHINDENRWTEHGHALTNHVGLVAKHYLEFAVHQCVPVVRKLIIDTTTLSYAGELEIISRLKGKPHHATSLEFRNEPLNETIGRFYVAIARLQGKISTEIELARVMEENVSDAVARVRNCFPKTKSIAQKELKPMSGDRSPEKVRAEADPRTYKTFDEETLKDKSASLDFIDDEDWDSIVDAYKNEYIPENRGPKDIFAEGEDKEVYDWEVEQSVADNFVSNVRDGTVDAANEAGIEDFIWIAVMDSRTRPEHRAKNGLTSTEIEAKLKKEWQNFEDQTIIPPGGFNCRCRPAPYFPEMADEPKLDYGDFQEWLDAG